MAEPPVLDLHFRLALERFSLEVELRAGPELVVIFGPSGAGKSLTLRALAGLAQPDAGYITVGGRTWFDSRQKLCLPPQERQVGYVPQNYGLFPHLTVAGNVAFGLHQLPRAQVDQRVADMLAVMRLEDQADRRPAELSGGQQQRVALARALVTEPQLLLMDEPLGALDASLREHLREEVRAVQARFHIPTLLITHDLAEAYSLAQQLVVLDGGKVIQTGPREHVFRRPATPAVARFLGMTNILRGQLLARQADELQVDWLGHILSLPVMSPDGKAARGLLPGQEVDLGIRPEEIMFVRQNQPLGRHVSENLVQGRIIGDTPHGFDHNLTVAVEGNGAGDSQVLAVRLPHAVFLRLGLEVGQSRLLALKAEALHLFDSAPIRRL